MSLNSPTATELAQHPVHQKKIKIRDEALHHLQATHAGGSNLTVTQKEAIEQLGVTIEKEDDAPAEPARSIQQETAAHLPYGLRTAAPATRERHRTMPGEPAAPEEQQEEVTGDENDEERPAAAANGGKAPTDPVVVGDKTALTEQGDGTKAADTTAPDAGGK